MKFSVFAPALLASTALGGLIIQKDGDISSSEYSGKRLLRLSQDYTEWVAEDLVNDLVTDKATAIASPLFKSLSPLAQALLKEPSLGPGFIDETVDFREGQLYSPQQQFSYFQEAFPKSIAHKKMVLSVLDQVSEDNLRDTITFLSTNFTSRGARSSEGAKASKAVFLAFERLIKESGRADVTIEQFTGRSTGQPSVIVRWEGSDRKDEVVVIGSHLDSTAGFSSRAPGADDDASGLACVFEVLRILLNDPNFKPSRSIHFMAFAAEELGLLGSKDISKQYSTSNVNVYAMLQMEMAGYAKSEHVTILTDASKEQAEYLSLLAGAYLGKQSFRFGKCEYGCSDHASFFAAGYRAACIAEAGPFDKDLNPHIHSSQDTIDKLDMKFLSKFAKLGLAFVIELGM